MRETPVFAMEERPSPASCEDETRPDGREDETRPDGREDGSPEDVFGGLAALPVEVCERRPTCLRCGYVMMMMMMRRSSTSLVPRSNPLGGSEAVTCLYVNLPFFRNKSVQETALSGALGLVRVRVRVMPRSHRKAPRTRLESGEVARLHTKSMYRRVPGASKAARRCASIQSQRLDAFQAPGTRL